MENSNRFLGTERIPKLMKQYAEKSVGSSFLEHLQKLPWYIRCQIRTFRCGRSRHRRNG